MAGTTANARIWLLGDVYTAPTGTSGPTDVTTGLNAAFKAVGLLSADDGLVQSSEEDVTDHHAWGGILVRTTRSKHIRTFKFSCLEDNTVVFGLVAPGSTATDNGTITHRTHKVPTTNSKSFVIQNTDGLIVRRLHIPTAEAFLDGDIETNEEGIETRSLLVKIYPASDGVLFHEYSNDSQQLSA